MIQGKNIVIAFGGEPIVNCPAPRSPDHGQTFLYQDGRVVKYVCEPGYVLYGKEFVRCVDGKWEDEITTCLKIDENGDLEEPSDEMLQMTPPLPPPRPLFSWGNEEEIDEKEQNSTSDDEMPMSDEARLRMVMYPRRRARIVTTRVRPARINSASELEDEEKKRSNSKKETSATTIHLEGPPSSIFVRRTLIPGKVASQEQSLNQQYRTATVRMTVEEKEDPEHVQVVALPRAAVAQNDKGEDQLRQMYWWAAQNYHQNYQNYPRQASLVEYRSGSPVAMTLSESQIAWINSLHPDLRDQYLRDLYVVRAEEAVEGARAQAFLRRYEDAYLYPYLIRQPVSVVRDPVSVYDYSCNQAGSQFVTAPKLPNAHIARYDRRQNPNTPRNHYLSAVYRCNPGFVMIDPRFTELHCSRRSWVGTEPICIPRS
ncbi:uncharacterized protein [Parasteatoda tepidariorum]|uniref:uncharacterized protein isoform X2 n=1 Tax=Parasteatoda tepidariorum TaxID=114398 RepID=UPI001C71E0B0|nr:uncharacterized protein LOC107445308 isoform X2 [Parasteatoda tepidariorum]